MYLKKKEKKKKKPQQSCLFQTKRLFFFLLAKSFGRQAKELLISCLTSGEAHVRQQAQQGPLAHGKALSGPYLISWQGLALHPQQCEKKSKRKSRGRKEGVCHWEGGDQRGPVSQAVLRNMAGLYLGLLCCLLLLKITTAVSPAFHGRGMTSHLFSCEAEQRAHWGDNAPFQTQLGERVAKEIGNMIHSLKSLSR